MMYSQFTFISREVHPATRLDIKKRTLNAFIDVRRYLNFMELQGQFKTIANSFIQNNNNNNKK